MKLLNKVIITGCSMLLACTVASADNASTAATVVNPNSNAFQFGQQAGSIAGAAQACGQDISAFTARINEALFKLSSNDAERLMAMTMFQRSLQQAQNTQANSRPIPCSQIIKDYNSLPLMRPDYEQTVMPKLNPAMTTETSNSGTTANANKVPAQATTPVSSAPATPAANNSQQPATAPAAQAPANTNTNNAISPTSNAIPAASNPVNAALNPAVPQQQTIYSNNTANQPTNSPANAVTPQSATPPAAAQTQQNQGVAASSSLPPPPDLGPAAQPAPANPNMAPGASVTNPAATGSSQLGY